MPMKYVIISAGTHALLIREEEVVKNFELRIPLIEDYAVPSDFAYLLPDGTYEIAEAAIEHARRRGYIIPLLEDAQ